MEDDFKSEKETMKKDKSSGNILTAGRGERT